MASGSTTRVKWVSHPGTVLCSMPAVGVRAQMLAEACAERANGMLSAHDGYRYPGFEVVPMEMNGFVVRTKTDHARRSQAKNKTLTKAFGSIG